MKILVVCATNEEILPLKSINSLIHKLDFLVTGPGMVATTYQLTKYLSGKKYDLAINCGIAGSFNKTLAIGEVVWIKTDVFSELGAEDGDNFLSFKDIALSFQDTFESTFSINPEKNSLRKVNSITVNTVHGNEKSIDTIRQRNHADIESMEGAAFFYVCENENVPSIQLRSISNYIERRNKESWNIPLAIKNLDEGFRNLISII
jgi:futalosine hydrolase